MFDEEVTLKLQKLFKFSTVEERDFTYCGCKISQKEDGSVLLDQNEYIKDLEQIERVDGEDDRKLSKEETLAVGSNPAGELLFVNWSP